MGKSNDKAVRRIPERTCVACREKKAKRELLRLVRGVDDNVALDSNGKARGRGVYLCPSPECWEKGVNGGRVEHSLKTALTRDNRQQLLDSLKASLEDNGEGGKLAGSKELEEQVSG